METEIDLRLFPALFVCLWMAIDRLRWYAFPCSHSHFSQAGLLRKLLWELHAAHVRLLLFVYLDVSIMFGTLNCLVLASRSIARGGRVTGSPKVHDRDCLIRLHTMTALLDFTRCSPSCSSYLRRSFVRLSCTSINSLIHFNNTHCEIHLRNNLTGQEVRPSRRAIVCT